MPGRGNAQKFEIKIYSKFMRIRKESLSWSGCNSTSDATVKKLHLPLKLNDAKLEKIEFNLTVIQKEVR